MDLFRHTKPTLNHSATHKPLVYKNNGSYTTVIKRPPRVPKARINTGLLRPLNLLPLNSSRWFGCNVIDQSVDMWYLVNNSAGNPIQDFIWDSGPVGCHKIGGRDGA